MSRLLAAVYDFAMRRPETACLGAWRDALLADVAGDVLEVGAGTGANLPRYPGTVRSLVVAEPDHAMRAKLARRVADVAPPFPVEISAAALGALPFDDARFDVVVATLVLCTVADPVQALADVRRVLKPGGRFVFLEHVAADEGSARFASQRRVDPIWRRLAGGCRVVRRTEEAIRAAGFVVERCARESMRGAPSFVRPTIRGVARRDAGPSDVVTASASAPS